MSLTLLRAVKHRLLGHARRPVPVHARQLEDSIVFSADDDPAKPSDRLLDLGLQATQQARSASMARVVERMTQPPFFPDVWPGEHYKLLAGLMAVSQPKVVIEIGTWTGLSALAMLHALPTGSRLHTFDIIPWDQVPGTCLRADDFQDGALKQIVVDVSDASVMQAHSDLFHSADIIFADGPKDGVFEPAFLRRLAELGLKQRPLVIFDDIRIWNMLAVWRGIRKPKLDMTSFGHWSGTGFIDWTRHGE